MHALGALDVGVEGEGRRQLHQPGLAPRVPVDRPSVLGGLGGVPGQRR